MKIRSFLACLCLVLPLQALATAPRISAEMFGAEKRQDIAAYLVDQQEMDLMAEIVAEAFRPSGLSPSVDAMPSRQLARYALSSGDAPVLMGTAQDLPKKGDYRKIGFYIRPSGEAVFLIFGHGGRADRFYDAFESGLRRMLKSGKYAEILGKHLKAHGDAAERVERLNPQWK